MDKKAKRFEDEPYVEDASVPGDNDPATALDPALATKGQRRVETGTIEPREVDAATQVLDIRRHPHNEQIRGALRYDPKKLLEVDKLVLPLAKENRVVLYADDERSAQDVASRLLAEGYSDVVLLSGGINEWKAQGLQTEELTQEQPIPGEEDAGIRRI